MNRPLDDSPTRHSPPPGIPAWEWIPVGLLPLLAIMIFWPPSALAGPLWSSLAAGLAPGCAWRISGRGAGGLYRAGLAAALMVYLGRKQSGLAETLPHVLAGWPWLAAGVAVVALQPVLGAWRWRVLLAAAGVPMRYAVLLRITLAGQFFNLTVPGSTGGDLARIGFLAQATPNAPSRWEGAAASVGFDRMLGLPALFILLIAAYAINADWAAAQPLWRFLRTPVIAGACATLALPAVLLGGARSLHAHMAAWAARHATKKWGRPLAYMAKVTGVTALYGGQWGAASKAVAIGVAGHAANAIACMLFAEAVTVRGVPGEAFLLISPGALAINSIPVTPGGVGQGEMAFSYLLGEAMPDAGNGDAGLLMMLCMRLGLLLTGVIGGLIWLTGKHRLHPGGGSASGNGALVSGDGQPASDSEAGG